MSVFVAGLMDALEWLLTTRLGTWIASAFLFLGISFGTEHLVVQPSLDQLKNFATSGFGSDAMGTLALQWLGVLNFDRALSMIISAVTTKYAVTSTKLFLQKKLAT